MAQGAKKDQIMNRNTNREQCYFRMKPKLIQKLDKRIARMGYPSRSRYFTDVALVTIGEKEEQDKPLPEHVRDWLDKNKPPLTEQEIRQHLETAVRTILFPVLALKGADIAHETAWKTIRTNFREEHGMWITESDIREAIEEFASIHHAELTDYRNKRLEGETE